MKDQFVITRAKVMKVTEHLAYKDGVLYQASCDIYSDYVEWNKVITLDEAVKKYGGVIND